MDKFFDNLSFIGSSSSIRLQLKHDWNLLLLLVTKSSSVLKVL